MSSKSSLATGQVWDKPELHKILSQKEKKENYYHSSHIKRFRGCNGRYLKSIPTSITKIHKLDGLITTEGCFSVLVAHKS